MKNIKERFEALSSYLLFFALLLFFASSIPVLAKSGVEHTSDAMQYIRGVNREIIKDINSQIIDWLPWSETAGGKGHREDWGHVKEWYDRGLAGVDMSEQAKKRILEGIKKSIENNPLSSGMTTEQVEKEVQKYYEQISHVSGKQLITGLLKRNYPTLTNAEALDLAEMIQASHLNGDLTTPDNVVIDLSNFRETLLRSPSSAAVSGMNKAAMSNALKSNPTLTAEEFLHSGINRESMIAQHLYEKNGYAYSAGPGARYATVSIDGVDCTIITDRSRLQTFLRRFADRKATVPESLYRELLRYNEKNPGAIPLDNVSVLPVDETQINKSILESANKQMRTILRRQKLASALDKLESCYRSFDNALNQISPDPNVKAGLQSAIIAAFFSGMSNGWQVISGDKDPLDALKDTAIDSALAGISVFISKAIIQQIAPQKWLVTTFANDFYQKAIEQTTQQTINNAVGAFANYGVATFIFDETRHLYNFCTGDIDEKEFIKATGQSMLKASVSGLASSAAVMWGASPGGPVVMAVSMGTYMLVSKAISVYDEIDDKNYFFIEDALGKLPLEIQRKETIFSKFERKGGLLESIPHSTIFDDPDKTTVFDGRTRKTIFDNF